MKTPTIFLFSFSLLVTSDAADPVTIKDPEGDATFTGDPLPAFDLKAVTFEGLDDNRLKLTFTGSGPMADLGATYSWFAAWLDLDFDLKTGDYKYGDAGCDLILGVESDRKGGPWTGEVTAKSAVGREFPATFEKAWTEGDQAFAIFQSELFAKYPHFRAVAFAHHDGDFVDNMHGGGLNLIKAFDPTKASAPRPDPFAFQRLFTVRNAKYIDHNLPLAPGTKRIQIKMTPQDSTPGARWASTFYLSIEDNEDYEAQVRLLFIQKEKSDPFQCMIRTKADGETEESGIARTVALNQAVTLGFEWSKGAAKILVNGELIKTVKIDFEPRMSSVMVSGATVLAEKLVIE